MSFSWPSIWSAQACPLLLGKLHGKLPNEEAKLQKPTSVGPNARIEKELQLLILKCRWEGVSRQQVVMKVCVGTSVV